MIHYYNSDEFPDIFLYGITFLRDTSILRNTFSLRHSLTIFRIEKKHRIFYFQWNFFIKTKNIHLSKKCVNRKFVDLTLGRKIFFTSVPFPILKIRKENFKYNYLKNKYYIEKIPSTISATENFTSKIENSRVVKNIFPGKVSHDS